LPFAAFSQHGEDIEHETDYDIQYDADYDIGFSFNANNMRDGIMNEFVPNFSHNPGERYFHATGFPGVQP